MPDSSGGRVAAASAASRSRRSPTRGRHAGLRLQRRRRSGAQYRALDAGARAGAAPDLLRGQGQRQSRGAPGPARSRRRRRHRLRRRAGPRARGRASRRTAIVFSGVGKTDAELDGRGASAGIGQINIESAAELDALAAIADAARPAGRASASASTPTSPRHPSLHLDRHRAASSSAFRPTRWCRSRRRDRGASACSRSTRHRDAPREPAPRRRAVSRRASRGCSSWWPRSAAPGSPRIDALDIGGGLGIRYRDERPLGPGAARRGGRSRCSGPRAHR